MALSMNSRNTIFSSWYVTAFQLSRQNESDQLVMVDRLLFLFCSLQNHFLIDGLPATSQLHTVIIDTHGICNIFSTTAGKM